jgi:hypothetical protein
VAPETVAKFVCVIAAIGIVIDSWEMIAACKINVQRFPWAYLRTALPTRGWASAISKVASLIAGTPQMAIFQFFRLGVAVGAVVGFLTNYYNLGSSLAFALCACQILISLRFRYGLDGSDQMHTIVWAGLAMVAFAPAAGLSLIAGESLLSYLISGAAKLAGPLWRSGAAAILILATATHGSPYPPTSLKRYNWLLSRVTIAFEIAAPFLVLVGPVGAITFVFIAATFHISTAVMMGLNNFVWSFGAALIPLVWLAYQLPWA